ncbi:PaaI family thioesterase [Stutzerimonas zhaodongensis]|uniref:PaaI family thioesterase n=1 Tax=Stutzerimonas zhaodongensis TaxID=1176257 RepID=A0A3M2HST4_9GAMM|nr:PaaI family thioesterase [Stutzerimonas zhaodongensis]MCQ2030878.1 PaaI family thioesterase [Stutzerimonas zhaodongensis]MCQ4316532.1 PaaI family thioesterase [Stutzerimonas zhaodongensis]RMH88844.1 PaaI family thioesterase [Stutzerimonas zhaodongensis]
MPTPDYSSAQLQQVHASVTGFFQDIGCELTAYGSEHATLALELLPRHLNNASNMHGGVMATLMDVAMGLCGTWEPDPAERRVATTLSMNINFSKAAVAGSRVRAVARCRSSGHKVFMASCDLLDEKDRLIAFGEGVFKRGALRRELPA